MSSEGRGPMRAPRSPAIKQPMSGRKTIAVYTRSPLHGVDVFNRDGAAVAEKRHENGEADGRLGGSNGQNEHRENLADEITQKGGERDEVDVHGEQNELDRHQDDDDVLPVQEDAEDAEREQNRGNRQIM